MVANLGLLLTMLMWGGFIPVLNLVFDRWDPWSLAAIRYWIALPLLAAAIRLSGPGPLLPEGIDWRRVALIGGLGFGGFGAFFTVGVAHANPITAAIFSSAGPVVAALVARFAGVRGLPRRCRTRGGSCVGISCSGHSLGRPAPPARDLTDPSAR